MSAKNKVTTAISKPTISRAIKQFAEKNNLELSESANEVIRNFIRKNYDLANEQDIEKWLKLADPDFVRDYNK
jgi:histone H3/H4